MPSFVLRSGNFAVVGPQSLDQVPQFAVSPEMVPRNCRLGDYDKRRIPEVSLEAGTEIIAYASPDSTYAVTKRLMDDLSAFTTFLPATSVKRFWRRWRAAFKSR
jgi:hypothetical protein